MPGMPKTQSSKWAPMARIVCGMRETSGGKPASQQFGRTHAKHFYVVAGPSSVAVALLRQQQAHGGAAQAHGRSDRDGEGTLHTVAAGMGADKDRDERPADAADGEE